MSALTQAQDAINWADGEKPDLDHYFFQKAQAYAAIAQAQAAERQAAALERIADALIVTNGGLSLADLVQASVRF